MRNVRRVLCSLALSLVVFTGVAGLLPSVAQAASYTITITESQFIPSALTAAVGDTITFINNTTATQSAKTSVASGFNTGDIGPSKSKQVTLVNEGTFSYSSLYNAALTGSVTVGAGSSLTSTTTSTDSTSQTAVVSTTQPQPVSGTMENLVILLVVGGTFVAFGTMAQFRRTPAESVIVSVPLVSSTQGKDVSTPTPDQHI
jgi:plastocyanin